MDIAQLVVSVLILASSCATPLIVSVAFFITHIRKSKCCGSYVELEDDEKKIKKEKIPAIII
jgi:hypothetical protein